MTIELKCICGKSITLGVRKMGWWTSAKETAKALKWKVCEDYDQGYGKTLDGYCPNCWHPVPVQFKEPMPCPRHAP